MADRLKIRVHYKDQALVAPVVTLGGFAQIATKRKFGLPALKTDDPEVLMFGVFVELNGPAAAADPEAFDKWLVDVDYWEAVRNDGTPDEDEADTADPPMAAIPSDSSPDSPPTSD